MAARSSRSIPLLAGLFSLALNLQGLAADDPLPRRAWLGAALEPGDGGVRVRAVMPGSSAEAAQLVAGDVIRSLNGTAVTDTATLVKSLRALKSGQEARFDLMRGDKAEHASVSLKEWPREREGEGYQVEYGSVASRAGRLRTILYRPSGEGPAGGRFPAVFVIQGLGMASLDNPRPDEPVESPTGMGVYRTIAAELARAGFIVLRLDKAGCGDSEGNPAALDFDTELDGYRQALAALKSDSKVDPDRLFLFGHSMGGVFAPILAGETPIKGVAVYGTVLETWFEYVLENQRRQHLLAGGDYASLDRAVRLSERFHHEFLVDRKPPSEILKAHPELAEIRPELGVEGDQVFGRHFTFFQQLGDVNLPEAWDRTSGRALALWGAAEYVSSRHEHEAIAENVNARRPGQGLMKVVPDSDHGFSRAVDAKAAMEALAATTPTAGSRFNPAIIEILRAWLLEQNG